MRRKDTLERRNRRFLLPLLELTFPALAFVFALEKLQSAICGLASLSANRSACMVQIPPAVTFALIVVAAAGIVGSCWRFYKDYICHERFDGLL